MKKKILILTCIAILGILSIGVIRLSVGWRPFRSLQSDDLYYVGLISMTGAKMEFLEDNEIDEFVSHMREIRVFPCTTDWEEIGDINIKWFVFEYESKKGEMILVKTYKMLVDTDPFVWRYWVSVNDDIYQIDAETYAKFDTFVQSFEN